MLYVWLAVFAIGIIIELIIEGSLVSIWFSIGAIIPMILAMFGNTSALMISIQFVAFGIVSALCLIFLRKITRKWMFKNTNEKTNMDAYQGQTVKIINVSEDGEKGTFKLNGIEYVAIFEDEKLTFTENEHVVINKFKGNKAVVSKKGE